MHKAIDTVFLGLQTSQKGMLEIVPSKTSPTNGTMYWVFLRSTVSRSASVATCSYMKDVQLLQLKNLRLHPRLE